MQWFRFYSEVLNDDKVQKLPSDIFKIWVNCLCLASSLGSMDGKIGTLNAVSFALRETNECVSSAFHALVNLGFIETDGETFQIKNWKKRQYKSDTSTNRVREHRKRSKTVTCNRHETPQSRAETDTERTRTDAASPVGFLNEFGGGFGGFIPTLETAEALRDVAPGWDQHFLIKSYNNWQIGKDRPRNPQAAFIGWAKSFTRGKMPA